MEAIPYIALVSALAALVLAAFYYKDVKAAPPGNDRMVALMEEIQKGARTFLRQEYTWVAGFVVVMAVLIPVITGVALSFLSYVLGAVLSAGAGYVGMTVATMANARTTNAAQDGPAKALPLAFRGGAVMGFAVAGLALLGLTLCYLLFVVWLKADDAFEIFTAFGLGASSIALFARVGGGIYTKAADVGADLVGKVEAGIPEDDPRNPASIADAVGDNVGDVAGMGADLFESYSGSIIAPVALTAFTFGLAADGAGEQGVVQLLMFPMAVAFVGMIAAIVGSFAVRGGTSTNVKDLAKQLHMGTYVAMGVTVIGTLIMGRVFFGDEARFGEWYGLPLSVIGGLATGWGIGKVAEIWTSDHYPPVRRIAAQTETGPATTVLAGVSAGMMSVAASVALIGGGVLVAYWGGQQTLGDLPFGGVYGIAVAAVGMLATTGMVVSVDAYGPIADNAGGIAEMAELDPSVREVTDALDSLGNTTAAVAKGFAVGSAALTALALFKSFEVALFNAARDQGEPFALNLSVGSVDVFIGLFLGAMVPFLFAALTIDAVGRAAHKMIEEVRRQFPRDPGPPGGRRGRDPRLGDLRGHLHPGVAARDDGAGRPGRGAAAGDRVHRRGHAGRLPGRRAGDRLRTRHLHGQRGRRLGQRQEVHRGRRPRGQGIGRSQGRGGGRHGGRPFKDTAGPSMNILIKVMTIVSLVFASAFV